MSGYARIHRSIMGHPAFRNDAEAMAFAWMVIRASWRPTRVRYKERAISLDRGQLSISQRDMAAALDRDKAWVERLWKRLKSEAMIEVSSEAGVAVVTICNYNEFQASGDGSEAAGEAVGEAGARQGRGTEQRREEKKKLEREDSPLSPRAKRAERLPEGWKPEKLDRSTNAGRIARERGTDWMTRTFESFENYWRAKSGRDATKVDWQRTWANWVVTQHERDGRNGRQAKSTSGYGSTVDAAFLAIEDARREGP